MFNPNLSRKASAIEIRWLYVSRVAHRVQASRINDKYRRTADEKNGGIHLP
jgi:hypothetical protein